MIIGYSQTPYKEGVTPVLDRVATVNPQAAGGATLSDVTAPGTVASIQPGGEWATRPEGANGDFEVFFGISASGCLMAICPTKNGIGGPKGGPTLIYPYRVIG